MISTARAARMLSQNRKMAKAMSAPLKPTTGQAPSSAIKLVTVKRAGEHAADDDKYAPARQAAMRPDSRLKDWRLWVRQAGDIGVHGT